MHVDIIKCEACDNQFTSKDDLAVHINEKHFIVPRSVSDCKCSVVDSVCKICWVNCEWLENTSEESK